MSQPVAEAVAPVERVLPLDRSGDIALLTAALDRLESLPVVNGRVRFNEQHNNGVGRIYVNLWCRGEHAEKKVKQPYIDLTKGAAVPTYQRAAEMLLAVVEKEHAGCVAAAEQAKAASSKAGGSSGCAGSCCAPNVLEAMVRLQAAKAAAREANAIALAAEQAKDVAEAEVAAIERMLDPKRQRTEEAAAEEQDGPAAACNDWDLADHRREMTRVMNRRADELVVHPWCHDCDYRHSMAR